jgi:hypothetical protein
MFGHIPPINALAAMFSFMSASMFTLFAMWFDMEANKDLKGSSVDRHIIRSAASKVRPAEKEARESKTG